MNWKGKDKILSQSCKKASLVVQDQSQFFSYPVEHEHFGDRGDEREAGGQAKQGTDAAHVPVDHGAQLGIAVHGRSTAARIPQCVLCDVM